mmetsp:Transcript_38042/g.120113  ORF Transcript_38042/g.120113 Transcript_38042/m.120113 type:complete len:269 (-) Transcript_38042:145-951(-)
MADAEMRNLRVVVERRKAEEGRPAFCLAWDEESRRLVVGVRGLDEVSDVFTAIDADPAPLLDGTFHRGALRGADWLLGEIQPYLDELRPASVYLLGHSLGGAVATAAAVRLTARGGGRGYVARRPADLGAPGAGGGASVGVAVMAFGPPPCVGRGVALEKATGRVDTLVHGNDIVARLSEANAEMLVRNVMRSKGYGFSVAANPLLLPGHIRHIRQVQGVWECRKKSAEDFVAPLPLAEDGIVHHRLFSYTRALEESAFSFDNWRESW